MGQLKSAFSCVHVWREKVFLSCDLLSNNKMAVISKFERGKALGMIAGGMTRAEVSWKFSVAKSTITRLMQRAERLGKEQAMKVQPGRGRKNKWSLGDLRILLQLTKRYPTYSAARLKRKAEGRLDHLSVRRLREMLLRACFPSKRCGKKPMLTKAMKARSMGVYFS